MFKICDECLDSVIICVLSNKISKPINPVNCPKSPSTLFGGASWGCPVFPTRNRQRALESLNVPYPGFLISQKNQVATRNPFPRFLPVRKVVNNVQTLYLHINPIIMHVKPWNTQVWHVMLYKEEICIHNHSTLIQASNYVQILWLCIKPHVLILRTSNTWIWNIGYIRRLYTSKYSTLIHNPQISY